MGLQRALSWGRQPPGGAQQQQRSLSWGRRQPAAEPPPEAQPRRRALSWDRRPPARQAGAAAPPLALGHAHDNSPQQSDLTLLPNITDETILKTIRERFLHDHIYTSCYQLLVAVNPLKLLPSLYTADVARACAAVAAPGGTEAAPAHIWRVSGGAYAGIRRGCELGELASQTIVVTGESGSGKTESARLLQSHLLSMSALAPELKTAALAQTLLESTLLLEAFGNARTSAVSPNSSRFGKFTVLVYDDQAQLTGAYVETYLLETSRVAWREPGQRNFHSLYMLCAARAAAARLRLPSQPARFYRWLLSPEDAAAGMEAALAAEEPELAERFDALCATLARVGVPEAQLGLLWATLSAVLYLGNIGFVSQQQADEGAVPPAKGAAAPRDGVERSAIGAEHAASVAVAASLLGVERDPLAHALTHREVHAGGGGGAAAAASAGARGGGELVSVPLSPAQAAAAQVGTAQAVYAALFGWVVRLVNASLQPSAAAGAARGGAAGAGRCFVGILDLFGFESLRHGPSSLEQLCINAANERVQNHFNRVLLAALLAEWRAEGLSERFSAADADGGGGLDGASAAGSMADDVALADTAAAAGDASGCIALLERPSTGLFSLLDTQSALGAGSDEAFLAEVRASLGAHARLRLPPPGSGHDFGVLHYAGEVKYSAKGLVAKNREPLPEHMGALLRSSSNALLAALFPEGGGTGRGGARTAVEAASARAASRRSVSAKFRYSLHALMGTVQATSSHFVRCVKPNAAGQPALFERPLVAEQLRNSGVLEIARIYGAGFPVRMPHAEVVREFGAVCPAARVVVHERPLEAVELLLRRAGVEPSLYRVGRTKLFARRVLALALERAAHTAAAAATVSLQAAARRAIARQRGERADAAVTLQAAARRLRARDAAQQLRQARAERISLAERASAATADAARRVQAAARGRRDRQRTQDLKAGAASARAELPPADGRPSAGGRGAGTPSAATAAAQPSLGGRAGTADGPRAGTPSRRLAAIPSYRKDAAIARVVDARILENLRSFDVALGQPGVAVGSRAEAGGADAPAPTAAAGAAPEPVVRRLVRALSFGRQPARGSPPIRVPAGGAGGTPRAARASEPPARASGGQPDTGWLITALEERAAEPAESAARAREQRKAAPRAARPGTKRARAAGQPAEGAAAAAPAPADVETPRSADAWAAELEKQLEPMRRQAAQPSGMEGALAALPTIFGAPARGPTVAHAQPPPSGASTGNLAAFLNANALGDLLPTLAAEEVQLPDLQLLTDEDLKELGLKVGPRARLRDAIRRQFGGR